jgi:uncharacterized protein YecE (DUF72 family)
MGRIHVGTCSWTEKTMVDLWYPKGVTSPEQRLRYYAARFDTVEVDSPYYAIPPRSYAEAWAQRTPEHFIFHVKAYGLMTGHEVDVRSLPPELAEFPHSVDRGRVHGAHPDMVDAAFDVFLDAIEPLRTAGKLGGVLMQFPPYFTAADPASAARNLDYLDYVAGRLSGYRTLVEFRHPSWVTPARLDDTLAFLRERDLAYVSVDNPQFPARSTMPPLAEATSDWAYVRMHGRNADTWYAKGAAASDRFDYDYPIAELEEWAPRIQELATHADDTFVMFNNNKYDYAQRNAAEIATILGPDVVAPEAGEAPPTLF